MFEYGMFDGHAARKMNNVSDAYDTAGVMNRITPLRRLQVYLLHSDKRNRPQLRSG